MRSSETLKALFPYWSSLQDVIRNLTITVTDTERLLLESEEREIMAKEEM
jgi:hypothetical protein